MRRTSVLCAAALALTMPAFAQQPNWLTRCNRQLNQSNNDTETGNYIFFTRGQDANAGMRVGYDYSTHGFATATVYPTAAKDLMNPYGGGSISINYFMPVDGKTTVPTVGQISMGAIGKDFKPVPGAPVEMKLVLDGAAFGPYKPKESANTDGMYSVWLDTADSDGDSKPPMLAAADFAGLAKAADAAKTAEIVLVQDGVDTVRMPVPMTKRIAWRDELPGWATRTAPTDGVTMRCGDRRVN
ncbi:MAG: hypothetical protein ABL956_03985 [Hyphomonadaceae bacterium]